MLIIHVCIQVHIWSLSQHMISIQWIGKLSSVRCLMSVTVSRSVCSTGVAFASGAAVALWLSYDSTLASRHVV